MFSRFLRDAIPIFLLTGVVLKNIYYIIREYTHWTDPLFILHLVVEFLFICTHLDEGKYLQRHCSSHRVCNI